MNASLPSVTLGSRNVNSNPISTLEPKYRQVPVRPVGILGPVEELRF